jgi:hypothetical protein
VRADQYVQANRLKNQYRALDDQEAEFLDSILEASKKKEAEIQKDTLEQLDQFRKHKEELERQELVKANTDKPVDEDAEQWKLSARKRKKGPGVDGGLLNRVKLRKTSTSEGVDEAKKGDQSSTLEQSQNTSAQKNAKGDKVGSKEASTAPPPFKPATTAQSPPAVPTPKKPTNPMSLNLGYEDSDYEED